MTSINIVINVLQSVSNTDASVYPVVIVCEPSALPPRTAVAPSQGVVDQMRQVRRNMTDPVIWLTAQTVADGSDSEINRH